MPTRYVLPAAQAVGRARTVDRTLLAPLRPVIVGPRKKLNRYAVERRVVGSYDPLAGNTFAYPDKTSDGTVDLSSVKLYASTLNLTYFTKAVGGGTGTATPSATYPNQVRLSNYVVKTNSYAGRNAAFFDRDVKVGDVVTISKVVSSVLYSLTTAVTGFVGEPVAAVTSAATADANNAASQSQTASATQVAGTPTNEVVATANGASYESTADGYVNRTYTVTVTQGSTGGNATTALLRVRSADGLDNQDNVVPAAFGSATTVGTKGLTVTFNTTGSYVSGISYSETDFIVGQQWTVQVGQAFTPAVATSAGTYLGKTNPSYVVKVTLGGAYAGTVKPQITVTTTDGSDSSGPTNVTAAATPVAVGSYGVTVAFSGTKLRKGDVYYVPVTAATTGALQTIVLQANAPTQLQGIDVNLTLSAVRADLAIPSAQSVPTNVTNWTKTASAVSVIAGLALTDPEFTNAGALWAVPVGSATLAVEYGEWVTAGGGTVVTVSAQADVAAALGTVHPDNPVAYAANAALGNTYGALSGDTAAAATTDAVLVVPIGGDPAVTANWQNALRQVDDRAEAYQLVPLSTDPAVQALFVTDVATQSADQVGFYRVTWLPSTLTQTAAVSATPAFTSDGLVATATVAATPGSSPTAYTTLTASSNVKFVTRGVRAGDVVRINFGLDAFGNATYDSYAVASVTSETTLVLASGPAAAVGTAVRFEVWRTYTKAELVSQLTAKAASYASSRVRTVWPDQAGFGGTTLAGYYLTAALAGLAGSVPAQQGLRNVGLEGFDDLSRSRSFFSAADLAALGAGGVFVVTQTPDNVAYVSSAVTTDTSAVTLREEMCVRDADMVRKAVQAAWAPYVGAGNVVSNIQQLLNGALASLVAKMKAGSTVDGLGPPVTSLTLDSVTADPATPDTVTVTLNQVGLPVPLNQIVMTLPVT